MIADNERIRRICEEYEHAKRWNSVMYAGHDLTLDIGFLLQQLDLANKMIAEQAAEIERLRKIANVGCLPDFVCNDETRLTDIERTVDAPPVIASLRKPLLDDIRWL